MSICSLVIHAAPTNTATVRGALEAMNGVEVHAVTDNGQMVVTVDEPDDKAAAYIFDAFREIDGVLSTSLIYSYFDQAPNSENDVEQTPGTREIQQ